MKKPRQRSGFVRTAAPSGVPTCFVGGGHGVHPDVVELRAGVLVQQGAKLTGIVNNKQLPQQCKGAEASRGGASPLQRRQMWAWPFSSSVLALDL